MINKICDTFCLKIKYPALGRYYIIRNWFLSKIGFKINNTLFANPLSRWPVNQKCFCGSKRKFKICCKNTISNKVDQKDLLMIKTRLIKKGIRL